MPDTGPTAEGVGNVVTHVVLDLLAIQLAEHHLNYAGLVAVRAMLSGPVPNCPCAKAVLLTVIEQLAPLRGIEPGEDPLWVEVVGEVPDLPPSPA